MNKTQEWLPHLNHKYYKDVSQAGVSLILEAWRRGLTVTLYDGKFTHYSIDNNKGNCISFIKKSLLVSSETIKADEICSNKELTKRTLTKVGLRVPKGYVFDQEDDQESILSRAQSIGFPLVLKPISGSQGKGVFANIKDIHELKNILFHVRDELNYTDIIMEEHINGDEYRVFVLQDRVLGVVKRIPANITGDGKHTISELINMKNIQRKKNPNLAKLPIKIDNEVIKSIEKEGYILDSVLPCDKLLMLRNKSNVSAGGDPIDVTDEIPQQVKEIAIDAVKAIPGLLYAGLDIIVNSNDITIIEVNTRAMFALHLFPYEGIARDIPQEIINYFFPETKNYNLDRVNDNFYIKNDIVKPLIQGVTSKVTIKSIPNERVIKEIILSGKVQGVGFRKWAQKKAAKLDLFGYCTNLHNGKVKLVVLGPKKNVDEFYILCKKGPKKAIVQDLEIDSSGDHIIHLGFYIKKGKQLSKNQLRERLEQTEKVIEDYIEQLNVKEEQLSELKYELKKQKAKIKKMKNSKTWKYTKFIRKLLPSKV